MCLNFRFTFPSVFKLGIRVVLGSSDFTIDKIGNFCKFISRIYEEKYIGDLKVQISLNCKWSEIKETVFALQPASFTAIPTTVFGSITMDNDECEMESGPWGNVSEAFLGAFLKGARFRLLKKLPVYLTFPSVRLVIVFKKPLIFVLV